MPLINRSTAYPSLQRGTVARHPGESLYPHLWRGAVLLMAPGLGNQGRQLTNWTPNDGLITSGVVNQPETNTDKIWDITEGNRGGLPSIPRHQLSVNVGVATTSTTVTIRHYPALSLVNEGALMFWCKLDINYTDTALQCIFVKGINLLENYGVYLRSSDGALIFEWYNGLYRTLTFLAPTPHIRGRWYHFAVTWSDLRMRGYRNGSQIGATSDMPAALVTNDREITMGIFPGFPANVSRMSFDDFRIYNRLLSREEISESATVDLAPYWGKPRTLFFMTQTMAAPSPSRAQYYAQMTMITGGGSTMLAPSPSQAQYRAGTGAVGRAPATAPGRAQYQAQTPVLMPSLMGTPARAQYQAQAIRMDRFAMVTPSRAQYRAQTPIVSVGILSTPSRIQYQAQTPVAQQALQVPPVRGVWYPTMMHMTGVPTLIAGSQVKAQYRATSATTFLQFLAQQGQAQYRAIATPVERGAMLAPSRAKWQALTPTLSLTIPIRDFAAEYQEAFQNPVVSGDWLIRFPDLGLNFSFGYDPDGTWIHRMITLSDIEFSAPPGGGITAVSNVTIQMVESDTGTNLLSFWDLYTALQGEEVTISFLLEGQPLSSAFQIFAGYVDRLTFQNGVSEFLCVDRSIQRNILVPRDLITLEEFPNADRAVLTRPKPLIYGSGTYPASHPNTNNFIAPLLLVDVQNNLYLVAAHSITFGGHLALYDAPNNLFLPLDNGFVTTTSGLVTLGISDMGAQTTLSVLNMGVTSAENATDGNSATFAIVGTSEVDSSGDGIGVLHVTPGVNGYPNTTTVQVTLTNHRRGPISDPTTTGTFIFRTLNSRTLEPAQTFLTAGPFNHVTSAQTNVYTLSNVVIPPHEIFDVYFLARKTGMIGSISNVYHIGEISVSPLIAFDAVVSGTTALVANPLPLQELRFNYRQPPLRVEWQQGVANATNAIDGISTTLALVGTTVLDSSLDGIGELIIGTSALSTLRANNTLVVNFLNHRRNVSSVPTVTGTFSILTLHPVQAGSTGPVAILRDNLFTTQNFRHVLNPQNTSFTAPSINLGASDRIGVRILAREEGGIGSGTQTYNIGEVTIESFYQPRGDSQQLFLYGTDWSGRKDVNGVLSYQQPPVPIGTLYHYADEVMASFVEDELGLEVDADWFGYASLFYRSLSWFLDGGIGAGWAVERADIRQVMDDIARQMAALLFPLYNGRWGIRAYGQSQTQLKIFDTSNILLDSNDTEQVTRGPSLRSSFQFDFGSIETVHNRFEVHYAYNPGSGKYDNLMYADHLGTNSPDGTTLTSQCAQAFNHYGKLDPYVIEAYWINDSIAAQYLLRHVVGYFSDLRLRVEFDVPIRFLNIVIGEPIRVIYPFIPASECDGGLQSNGAVFETHSYRISPTTGRIHIVASKKKIA